jgi:hypothetical protein
MCININFLLFLMFYPMFERSNTESPDGSAKEISAIVLSQTGNSSRTVSIGKATAKVSPEQENFFAESVDLLRLASEAKNLIDADASSTTGTVFLQIIGKAPLFRLIH